jgi:hypothetical protein
MYLQSPNAHINIPVEIRLEKFAFCSINFEKERELDLLITEIFFNSSFLKFGVKIEWNYS